ncbi:MFS transporter [Streptomyces sp. NPDC006553]|uniref:MFS transporter n=1 Tax=unclassified Streptomyces TaxID=2593676 RepID=UPI00224D3D86|nr:MFS transporter [Streptomyces sp. NBC_00233]MCX5228777.1 MFS transporter [Streptomyces sp. NBC_00233]
MTLTAHPEPATGPGPARAGRREWTALGVLMLPLLLVSMDVSVLYFAIPSISADLRPGATEQLWILDIYGFVLAGLLVTMGALGDRVGRRKVLLGGAALFGVASVAAAYAHSPGALIGARALLGIAGACLMPATLALIRVLFADPAQRAKAVTLWTSVMASGIALGPVVSGALVEHFWWGSVFLVNLPAMALLLVLGPLLLPESRGAVTGRFDVLSAALSLGALLPLIHGVKELAEDGWAPLPAGSAAVGLLVGLLFVRRQARLAHPMVDLALLRNRAYGGSVLANLLAMAATVGFAVFLTQYLQSVLGQSPFEAALWSLVPTAGVLAAAPTAAALAQKTDRAYVMAGGFLVAAAGFAWLAGIDRATPLWVVIVGSAVYAGGLVSAMTLANELALGAAPPERAGSAAAVLESGAELGGALGMALLGTLGAAVYTDAMPASAPTVARETLGGALTTGPEVVEAARTAFVEAMGAVAVGAAVLMVASAALSLALLRRARG